MIKLAVVLKGFLKMPAELDGATYRSQVFQIEADTTQKAYEFVSAALTDVFQSKFLTVPKDPTKTIMGLVGFNNMRAYHIDLFDHLEVEVKQIASHIEIPTPGHEGVIQ